MLSSKSKMAPLINSPSVIPPLILNLCTVSIAMCSKFFFNQMTPFNGDKIEPRVTVKASILMVVWHRYCWHMYGCFFFSYSPFWY
jgi:hypothetical protein